MAEYKELGVAFNRQFRNDLNSNFAKVDADIKNITTKALDQVVDAAKIEWLAPVSTFADLATTYSDATEGKTVMTRDSGKVYRFDGASWTEIQDIDPTAINEVDSRLSAQLAQTTHEVERSPKLDYESTGLTSWKKRFESKSVNVKDFGAKGDGTTSSTGTDDTNALKAAIAYAETIKTYKVELPQGIYETYDTLYLPPGLKLCGNGRLSRNTTIRYRGSGWAIATSGGFGHHRRNVIESIQVDITSTTAKGGILIGSETDNAIIPVDHDFINVEILDLKAGMVGVWLKNASGITMTGCRLNRGTGGTSLLVTANGNNTGVMTFNGCVIGGHNQNDVGLELRHGTGGLDGFTFNGCYFGGKKPVLISGTSGVKNVTLNSPHFEATTITGEYYAIDINSVHGLTINSVTFFGKSDPNFVAMVFRSTCSGVVVNGVDANEFLNGTLYKNLFSDSPKNSILSQSYGTGANRTIIQSIGNFSDVVMITSDGLKTRVVESDNIRTNFIHSIATGKKLDFGTTSPLNDTPLQARSRGDFRFNTVPSEMGSTGSKYIILGWMNTGSGTPGGVVECRTLTGN